MKKIFNVFMAFTIIFGLCGCSLGAKPEAAVDGFLSAVQSFDLKSMQTYISTENNGTSSESALAEFNLKDDSEKYFMDYLKTCASKMTYTIKSSKVNGDKATVTVDFKYIDSTPFVKAVMSDVITQVFATAFSGTEFTDEQADKLFTDTIKKQESQVKDTYVEKTVDINCSKKDGKWIIETNEDLEDVITANLVSAFKDISSAFGGSSGSSSTSIQ
jgi:hypothetical protein